MRSESPENIDALLQAVADGDHDASEKLFPLVYQTLHGIATRYMNRERSGHTLQPTALINEAFIKLTSTQSASDSGSEPPIDAGITSHQYKNLEHFVATAAKIMRQILINHAKAKNTLKRGGDFQQVHLEEFAQVFKENRVDLLALDEAMNQLAELDPQQHRLVELHIFGGQTIQQCAEFLSISERTAYYEWAHAKSWLRLQLSGEQS